MLNIFYGDMPDAVYNTAAFDTKKVFNASTCGDNCAKWLLKIAENEERRPLCL